MLDINPFDDIYMPTIYEVDAYYNGNCTIDDIYAIGDAKKHHKAIATAVLSVKKSTPSPTPSPSPVPTPTPSPSQQQQPPKPEEVVKNKYYFVGGSKNVLKSLCEPTDILVSKDTNKKAGTKAYQICNWVDWINRVSVEDYNEYETLRDTVNVYPYLDIENEHIIPQSFNEVNPITMLTYNIEVVASALKRCDIAVESVAISISSRPGKHSYRVVFKTDKVFESNTILGVWMKSEVKPNYLNTTDDIKKSIIWLKEDKNGKQYYADSIDWSVYSTDRNIRFLNQSKLGKSCVFKAIDIQEVPYTISNHPTDFLIGHYGQVEKKEVINVKVPEHIQKLKKDKETGVIIPKIQLPTTYLSELCDLIPTEIILNGTTCCKFIWAMARSGASRDLIHQQCQRTNNYDEKWVDYHINHSDVMNVNIGTLRYWACNSDKKAFHSLSKKYQVSELLNEISTNDADDIPILRYNDRYVRPFEFTTLIDTIAIKSHLGTGKTTQIVKFLKQKTNLFTLQQQPKRVIIISPRKSFTKFILGDLKESELNFKAYDECVGVPLSTIDYLVIQVESLWKLEDEFARYDAVICDESETILHQFYSTTTHRTNMIRNHIMFERIVSSAKKAIFADAFLNNRTTNIMKSLRVSERCLLIDNTYCPYQRKAIQLIRTDKKGGMQLTNPQFNPDNFQGKSMIHFKRFCESIMNDLEAGQKIAVVWGSKNKAKAFTETYLKNSKFNWRLYSSETSVEERDELQNVGHYWKKLDCLNYTSTITVGVNYDPDDPAYQYDKLYLYASASGGLPRDIAQALLRCRKIKTNTLVYTVDNNSMFSALYGREAIREAIKMKEATILKTNPFIKWEHSPKWAIDNYIENENENGAKAIAFNDIVNNYLKKSGYTIEKEIEYDDTEFELKCETVDFKDIPCADYDAIEKIKRKSKKGLASFDELLILKKYNFCTQLKTDDIKVQEGLWNEFIADITKESYFWNIVNEKHQSTEDYIKFESTQRYIHSASKKCLKRIVLDKVLKILDLKNTVEAFQIPSLKPYVKQFEEIEKEVYDAFTTHSTERKREFGVSNACDMLKMIFYNWRGAKLDTDRKRRRNGTGGRDIDFSVENYCTNLDNQYNLWTVITDRTEESQ